MCIYCMPAIKEATVSADKVLHLLLREEFVYLLTKQFGWGKIVGMA